MGELGVGGGTLVRENSAGRALSAFWEVREEDVYEGFVAAEGHGGLGPVRGEGGEAFSLPARQHHCKSSLRHPPCQLDNPGGHHTRSGVSKPVVQVEVLTSSSAVWTPGTTGEAPGTAASH